MDRIMLQVAYIVPSTSRVGPGGMPGTNTLEENLDVHLSLARILLTMEIVIETV